LIACTRNPFEHNRFPQAAVQSYADQDLRFGACARAESARLVSWQDQAQRRTGDPMPVSKKSRREQPRPRKSGSGGGRRTGAPVRRADPSDRLAAVVHFEARFLAVATTERIRLQDRISGFLPTYLAAGEVLGPEEATEYLHAVRKAIETEADQLAQLYTQTEWLWYLRRVPRSFFRGHLVTTEIADHALAESLTGLSRNPDDVRRIMVFGESKYPTVSSALEPVAKIACLAQLLGRTHAWLRRAGKGTRYLVTSRDLPEPIEDLPLERAITLFDERSAADLTQPWHPSLNQFPTKAEHTGWPLLGVGMPSGVSGQVSSWRGRLSRQHWAIMVGRFGPVFLTIEGLEASIQRAGPRPERWWPEELPSLVLLMQAFAREVVFGSEYAGVTLPEVGYLPRGRLWLMGLLDSALTELRSDLDRLFPNSLPDTGAGVLEHLEQLHPQLWPHRRGPVIRFSKYANYDEFADQVLIDLHAATQRLQDMITVSAALGGPLVNVNAARFEEAVQMVINASPWNPPPKLAQLRNRHLKLGSSTITDIDAIGQQGDTVLIVSCKNINRTPDYDAGEFKAVQGPRTSLKQAVAKWADVIQTLQMNPTGNNYDLSGLHLVGVIVTPTVMFLDPPGALTTTISSDSVKLYQVASLGELQDVLATWEPTA
jgi:hypothetical protein